MVTICKNEVFKWCKPGLICIICNILTQLHFQIGVPFTRETYLHEVLSHGQVECDDNNFTIVLKCRYGVNITRLISIDLTSLKFCHQCHTLAPEFIEVAIYMSLLLLHLVSVKTLLISEHLKLPFRPLLYYIFHSVKLIRIISSCPGTSPLWKRFVSD